MTEKERTKVTLDYLEDLLLELDNAFYEVSKQSMSISSSNNHNAAFRCGMQTIIENQKCIKTIINYIILRNKN